MRRTSAALVALASLALIAASLAAACSPASSAPAGEGLAVSSDAAPARSSGGAGHEARVLRAAAPPASPAERLERAAARRALRRDAVVEAVEQVGPAVVNISTQVFVRNPFRGFSSPFEWFFGGDPRSRRERGGQGGFRDNSLGSGVIVDPEGLVLTNEHVVAQADRIFVTLADERQVEAELIGADRASDLAVLRLKEEGPYPSVSMGRSDDLMPGETVIAIGNPFGLQNTVTTGVVSALGRTLDARGAEGFADFIQTDAAINPGNSGGALLNIEGELIGINTQIVARAQNLGFAIPIDRARVVLDELIHFGRVRPRWTGMIVEPVTARIAGSLGLSEPRGVVVVRRFAESPAEDADLRAGDVVLEIEGVRINSVPDYDTALARAGSGESVEVTLWRDEREIERSVAVLPFPAERAPALSYELLGFTVTDTPRGVMIDEIRPDSWLVERTGGRVPRLFVLEIDGRRVESARAFYEAVGETIYRRSTLLRLTDGRSVYRVSVSTR